MKIIDLSHSIHPGMPVYPGDTAPQSIPTHTIEDHGFREMGITFCTHLGTHLDVPAHIFPEGKTLDQMDAERFFGSCCCIDLSNLAGSMIDPADLRPYRDMIMKSEFVLINTSWSRRWGSDDYFRDFPTLSKEAASWLAAFPLKGVGIDTTSMDKLNDDDFPVHRLFLKRDICLIENLTRLDNLPGDRFLFSCLPLKIQEGDGSPVRAVAVFL